MSDIAVQQELAGIIQGVRLDTGMRLSGLRKAMDKRDDTIEVMAKIAGIFSASIDEAIQYVENSEDFRIGSLIEILQGSQHEAKEALDNAKITE